MILQHPSLKFFIRAIVDILLFLSIFILPLWITLFLILVFLFLYKKFYEGLFLALYISLFYQGAGGLIFGFEYDVFVVMILFFIIFNFARKFFRF